MGIVWTAIFWLTGIFAGRQFPLLPKHWILLAAITLFAALVLRKYPRHRGIFLLLFVFMLASLRSRLDVKILQPDDLGFYNDLDVPVTITGIVVDDPDRREDATRLRVRAERLVIPALEIARPIQGDVLVRSSKYEHWSYGDWIRVKGNLETPPTLDTFSYEDYLARKDIYSWMPQTTALRLGEQKGNPFLRRLYQMRGALLHTVYRILPDPEASLSAGILLGIESGITDDLYEDFNRTGTTHIIAISGFNITLIANIFIALSRRLFGSRRGLWIAGGGITLYTLLVGADAAVVRAAIMGGLALIARYWGRDTFGLASLGATGLLMTAIDPPVLWDVGFQLSFTATLGLILYSQPLERWSVKLLSGRINPEAAQEMGGSSQSFCFALWPPR